MKLLVQTRSGKEVVPQGLEVPSEGSVEDLQSALHQRKKKLYPSRQRLTLPLQNGEKKPTVLQAGKRLSDFDLADGSVVVLKDLGPQVGWTTVFFWEYFGPLVLYAIIYLFPQQIYFWHKHIPQKCLVQKIAFGYWSFHYIKRILETFFLHRYSHGTMPIFNLFRNCGYYWLYGAYIAFFINHPLYTQPPVTMSLVLFAVALICQLSNFWCHVILANLRPAGQKAYVIPRGFLFDYITCPNYTTEILGWLCFTFATSSLPVLAFALTGTAQMWPWAAAKHARLRKIFDGKDGREKYPRRWVMLPPIF